MDDIISRLSAIEDRAVAILDDVNKEKEKLAKKMKEKSEAWDLQVKEQAREKIEQYRNKAFKEQKVLLDAKRANATKLIMALQENYEKNHKKYVDDLFLGMIKE